MKFVLILSKYISRQFFASFIVVVGIFSVLISMIDAVEMLRKASTREVPFIILIDMVLLKLPILIQTIMPFIILVSAVLAYTALARRSELVVIRSAGVSVWEFLVPSIISAFAIGIFIMLVVNPLSAAMLNKYEHLNAKYFENRQNLLDISDTGLWIKQDFEMLPATKDNKDAKNEIIVHALDVKGSQNITLQNVEIIAFDPDDAFTFRVDAPSARLKDNRLILSDAMITNKDNKVINVNFFSLDTNLKQNDIQNSFADPQAISFFELPAFINKLEKSGFSAIPHIMQWHKILAAPFFFAAMVMVGAIFSLKAPRQGMIGHSITYAVIFGFIIYFLSNLVSSIGLSGSMPVMISAWIPILITMLAGVGFLLHQEDG
jgi:lipopolysaccharide export system permease protein